MASRTRRKLSGPHAASLSHNGRTLIREMKMGEGNATDTMGGGATDAAPPPLSSPFRGTDRERYPPPPLLLIMGSSLQ